ncbi:hypothetical protein FRC07_014817 [Ceratobasidium sp. 392]|nr:hypothetical protein FRC07_014817 [Ceratobasidium sp. 392]
MAVFTQLSHPDEYSSISSDATAYANRKKTYNLSYVMQWIEPGLTGLAEYVIDQLAHVLNRSRDEHFSPESLAVIASPNNDNAVLVGSKKFGNNVPQSATATTPMGPCAFRRKLVKI